MNNWVLVYFYKEVKVLIIIHLADPLSKATTNSSVSMLNVKWGAEMHDF